MFWKDSLVLTCDGWKRFSDLDQTKDLIMDKEGHGHKFRLVKEECFCPEYLLLSSEDKDIFMYVTRFTRFTKDNQEVYAFELKQGDEIFGIKKIIVKQRSKILQQVTVFKPLLENDISFFVEGVEVKKS